MMNSSNDEAIISLRIRLAAKPRYNVIRTLMNTLLILSLVAIAALAIVGAGLFLNQILNRLLLIG